jgi:putative amide transporter protein
MLLGLVLLYVGAVLVINGIWLLGQARAAEAVAATTPAPGEPAVAGEARAVLAAESHPAFIQNREIAILNVFTGFVGVVAAVTLAIHGNAHGSIADIRASAFILLFAFTYLWVAYNQFANAGGHAFGWYCLFVAITAIPAGVWTFVNAHGNHASIYLGVDWFAWSLLWFMFFLVLALERPIARITGWVAVLEGIGTSWVFAILILENKLTF